MRNWIPLSDEEDENVWDKVDQEFKFEPSVSKFPGFHLPQPFRTYDVSNYFGTSVDIDAHDDLEIKVLNAFQELTSTDEFLLALDWQHECFWINPFHEFPKNEFGEWPIPLFPDGDYYFFIEKNFRWGYLGHPWERSISIFGFDLIAAIENHKPKMFHRLLREG